MSLSSIFRVKNGVSFIKFKSSDATDFSRNSFFFKGYSVTCQIRAGSQEKGTYHRQSAKAQTLLLILLIVYWKPLNVSFEKQ